MVTTAVDPAAGDTARIRTVRQVVNQLRHAFTGPAYALADVTGEPLLYVGNEFLHTDITAAEHC